MTFLLISYLRLRIIGHRRKSEITPLIEAADCAILTTEPKGVSVFIFLRPAYNN